MKLRKMRMPFAILGAFLLAGCCGSLLYVGAEDESDVEAGELPVITEEKYDIAVYNSQQLGMECPAGLDVFEGVVYVCDSEAGEIVLFDKGLNCLKTIGNIGMGEGEFSEPMDVEVTPEHIYVLDAGNKRIQILDADGKFEQEIELPELITSQGAFDYSSLEVNSEKIICVGTDTVYSADNRIRLVTENGITASRESVCGHVFLYKDEFYAADMMELYSNERSFGAKTGKNYIYKVTEEGLESVGRLPNMYAPVGIEAAGDDLYMISGSFGQLDRVSLDGTVIEGIADLPAKNLTLCLGFEETENFYISDRDNKKIYHLKEK